MMIGEEDGLARNSNKDGRKGRWKEGGGGEREAEK